ncbi:MAG: hypothetical protein PVF18_07045 [Anaerolineales bacterium]|jgi:hypothetical protein
MTKRLSRRSCLLTAIIVVVVILCVGVGVGGYLYQKNRLAEGRASNTPPTIYVHTPQSGVQVPEGEIIVASATAVGFAPIRRVELWVNGELFASSDNAPTNSAEATRFEVSYDLPVPLGSHALVFRAIDRQGRVGQSQAIPIEGKERGDPQAVEIVVENEDMTLEELAEGLGMDPGDLSGANPNLKSGPLPPGTGVIVPPGSAPQEPPLESDDRRPVDIIQPAELPVSQPDVELRTIGSLAVAVRDLFSAAQAMLPPAPSDLSVTHRDCVVYMDWIDNAQVETHFTVWMQRLGGAPQQIATLTGNMNVGQSHYEFKSPSAGAYGFWVEAGNGFGSQPSKVEWIFIADLSCEDELASQLAIEALDMDVSGPYSRVYCYVSVEGQPEMRVPMKQGEFIVETANLVGGSPEPQGGSWNINDYWGEKNRVLIPIPADRELTLEGRCLGLPGNSPPESIGSFRVTIPESQWDGSRRELNGDGSLYSVGYKVYYLGSVDAHGAYRFIDTNLVSPRIESVTAATAEDPTEKDWAARHITLEWSWSGDPKDIRGFAIHFGEQSVRTVPKERRQEDFLLGTSCGDEIDFQVAAIGPGGSESPSSTVYTYKQPGCEVYAYVTFESIQTGYTDDCSGYMCEFLRAGPDINVPVSSPCDVLSAYYDIWATSAIEVRENYWGGGIFLGFTCNTKYYFNQIGDNDTLVVPIDPQDPRLRFGTRFREYDDFSWDDDIAVIGEEVYNTLEDWPDYDETFVYEIDNDNAWTVTRIRVRGAKSAPLNQP